MVSLRIEITGGAYPGANAAEALEAAHLINTPGTDQARIISLAVARNPHSTFPPPQCCGPTSTPPPAVPATPGPLLAAAPASGPTPASAPVPVPAPAAPAPFAPSPAASQAASLAPAAGSAPAVAPFKPGPAPGPGALLAPAPGPAPGPATSTALPTIDPAWGRWQRTKESSMMIARRAYEVAKWNRDQLNILTGALRSGAEARDEAWYFPRTTIAPKMFVPQGDQTQSFGRLIYDALINTPQPMLTTMPPLPTTTAPSSTLPPITTVWFRGNQEVAGRPATGVGGRGG